MASSAYVYINNCWGRSIDQKCVWGLAYTKTYIIDKTNWPANLAGTLNHKGESHRLGDPRMTVWSDGTCMWDGEIISQDSQGTRRAVVQYIHNNHLSMDRMTKTKRKFYSAKAAFDQLLVQEHM